MLLIRRIHLISVYINGNTIRCYVHVSLFNCIYNIYSYIYIIGSPFKCAIFGDQNALFSINIILTKDEIVMIRFLKL